MKQSWKVLSLAATLAASGAMLQAHDHGGGRGGPGRGGPRPSGPGENLAAFDTNSDGSVSGDELTAGLAARQAEMIASVDTDKDGAISAAELEAADDRVAERLARLDTDKDGAVSAAELAADVAEEKAEILERRDTNADGSLSAEELAAEPPGHDHEHGGLGGIDDFDTNNDGVVSGDELAAGLAARQAALIAPVDTNSDGSLSAEELAAVNDHLAEKLLDLDTNADGAVSAAELAAALDARKAEILNKLDTNKDGSLSTEEIQAGRPSGHGHEHIADLDANGDGSVTTAELEAGLAARQAAMLATVDTNGDGSISAEELAAADDHLERMLKALDTNGDGAVSAGELAAHLAARKAEILAKLDTNKDGTIDAAELAAGNTGCMGRGDAEEEAAQEAALVFGSGPQFIRGDVNSDAVVNIADPVGLAGYLFLGISGPVCNDAADANDDGKLDLSDAIVILQGLFQTGAGTIAAPFPEGGVDPTADSLSCVE